MFSNITIAGLLTTLLNLGIIIIKLFLLYLILQISSKIILWVYRSFIVPVFERRAYFFKYEKDVWYFESFRKLLWIFKLGRNKEWAIYKTLIGYVARSKFADNQDDAANDIYTVGYFGRERIGQAKFIDGVCKIILRRTNAQGDEFNDNDPVGYIDKTGKVFKYYKDRESLLKGKKLKCAEYIGQCELPERYKKKYYTTNGEENDDDTLPLITDERKVEFKKDGSANLSNDELPKFPIFGDTWFFFRENYPKKKKVKTICLKSNGSIPDGKKRFKALGWRILNVFAYPWDFKRLGWGYGNCKEDFWRSPIKEKDNGIRLIARAGAALLLIEYQGFLDYEDEKVRENKKGLAATAILSLCLYILLFPLLWKLSTFHLWFPFLGSMLSGVLAMTLMFFLLWVIPVHLFRLIMLDTTPRFERFLEMLNNNSGVISWMTALICVSVLGLISSIFLLSNPFFPLFFSALVAIFVNRMAYKQKQWPIDDPFNGSNKSDETEDEDSLDDTKEDIIYKEHKVALNTPTKNLFLKVKIPFTEKSVKDLRLKNPFRQSFSGKTYSQVAAGMINADITDSFVHLSKLKFLKSRINNYARKMNMSFIEKAQFIIAFAQPDNVTYEYDEKCEELLIEKNIIHSSLLEGENGGFKEYCRFPTESLFDKRGDCDCHAALAAGILSSCGIKSCYIIGNVNDGTGHAAIGIECSDELVRFIGQQNSFIDKQTNTRFLYVETTEKNSKIGDVPNGFEKMIEGNDISIIYPLK